MKKVIYAAITFAAISVSAIGLGIGIATHSVAPGFMTLEGVGNLAHSDCVDNHGCN